MPHRDLQPASPGEPDDIRRLLDIGGEGLLDEDVAPGLERVHRDPIMPEVGDEDADRRGGLPAEQFAVVGEGRDRAGRVTLADLRDQRLGAGRVLIDAADDRNVREREQPIHVNPRRPAAPDNPDPEDRIAHRPTRLGGPSRRTFPAGKPGDTRESPGHPAKPAQSQHHDRLTSRLYRLVSRLYFHFPEPRSGPRPEPPVRSGNPRSDQATISILSAHSKSMSRRLPPSALTRTRTPVYRVFWKTCDGGCGLAVKAPDCGSGYRGFESRQPPFRSGPVTFIVSCVRGLIIGSRTRGFVPL